MFSLNTAYDCNSSYGAHPWGPLGRLPQIRTCAFLTIGAVREPFQLSVINRLPFRLTRSTTLLLNVTKQLVE